MSIKTEMEQKGISIVIGSYNRRKYLELAIESVRNEMQNSDIPFEIIVVDGGSDDGSLEWLFNQKDIITIIQHNRGNWRGKQIVKRSWGYFMNLGFKTAQGKYICMLSDDCIVVPGAIRNGYNLFENKLSEGEKIGAIAFYWRNWPEMENYWVGLTLGNKMFVNHGIFLKKALEDVSFIDEDNYSFYYADSDVALKMWNTGYKCIDSKQSFIEHFSHAGLRIRHSNLDNHKSYYEYFLKKWEGIFYDKVKNNIGGWINLDYKDENHSAEKFKEISPIKYFYVKYIIYFLKKFIRILKKN